MAATSPADAQLADAVARFYDDPLGFVMFAFEWDTDPALQLVKLPSPWNLLYASEFGPDEWFCSLCDRIQGKVREHAFNGRDAVEAIREAIASGHGIGKSAGVAWLVNWIMSTRPFAKGTVTATTAPQLESKTWAEIAKWSKKSITGHWFDVTTGRGAMKMVHKDHRESWYCTAQTCREENSEAFAGQHAADSTSFYIFDEASGVPDKIWEVAEGGLTDGEPMWFAFGNPTQNNGEFYNCFHKRRHLWHNQQIDSRSVQITNKKTIDGWIEAHGIDSDFVKVRVRGMFPAMSAKQFISIHDVDASFGRHLRADQYNFAPRILTLDPAWDGGDETVFGLRQGLHFRVLRVLDKNDNDVEVANMLARFEDDYQADGVIIDKGYGTGVYSVGQTMNREWLLADFGSASPDPGCLNLRAFMWNEMKKWLKDGGAIPEDQVLYDDLIGPATVPRMNGVIQLESKEDMKRRQVPSPNRADALALSFAFPIEKKYRGIVLPTRGDAVMREYDPYAHLGGALDAQPEEHNPYANLR